MWKTLIRLFNIKFGEQTCVYYSFEYLTSLHSFNKFVLRTSYPAVFMWRLNDREFMLLLLSAFTNHCSALFFWKILLFIVLNVFSKKSNLPSGTSCFNSMSGQMFPAGTLLTCTSPWICILPRRLFVHLSVFVSKTSCSYTRKPTVHF